MKAVDHQVLIVGAGPTGMMLAAELALAGVDVAIVERRVGDDLAGSRAGGLHVRAIELLEQRGIADRFLALGKQTQVAAFLGVTLDVSDFPTRHPYGLALWQIDVERLLAARITELGVTVYNGRCLTGVVDDPRGVSAHFANGECWRALYLVGCDGGRSTVRKSAGIAFPGIEATVSNLIAEVQFAEEPELGMRHDLHGLHGLSKLDDGKTVRVLLTEVDTTTSEEPTLLDIREGLIRVYGSDYGVHSPTWISRFTDATRQAAAYRQGQILLAGDAAHTHPPDGGQGLQLGFYDAVNLGWKLAQVVHGVSPPKLLDSYHTERHAAGARALEMCMAATAMRRGDPRSAAIRSLVIELVKMDEPRRKLAGALSGLDICYHEGAGSPLLGRRVPDLTLGTCDGQVQLYSFLHCARPLLLNLGEPGSINIDAWAPRVQLIEARYEGPWILPLIGIIASPAAVLVRPDGYVAWVGEPRDHTLWDAMASWFGNAPLTGS